SLHGAKAAGRSPAPWTPELFPEHRKSSGKMPTRGWMTITVPGAVSGWIELSRRFGKLSFERLFEPAIRYARDGFLVSPITARAWRRSADALSGFDDWRATFTLAGAAPEAGERFGCEDQARTLESIAASDTETFY